MYEAPRYLSSPSNQATNPSLIDPAREPDSLAVQRFRTAPGSIVAAGLELARLSLGSICLRGCHEGLVDFLAAVIVVAVRAFESTMIDGLELIRNRTRNRTIGCGSVVPGSPPARYVGRRHWVHAVGARSGLGAVGAGSDHDVGKDAEEQIGMDAAKARGSQPGCIPLSQHVNVFAWSLEQLPGNSPLGWQANVQVHDQRHRAVS
jgi:hypothetical protein